LQPLPPFPTSEISQAPLDSWANSCLHIYQPIICGQNLNY
jgi:hypothetical protein